MMFQRIKSIPEAIIRHQIRVHGYHGSGEVAKTEIDLAYQHYQIQIICSSTNEHSVATYNI